jgi:DNA-binding NarL/FixJ family response regulator
VLWCIIASDNALYREALKALLAIKKTLQIGDVPDLISARYATKILQPDILLVDQRLMRGNARAVLVDMRKQSPKTEIVCLADSRSTAPAPPGTHLLPNDAGLVALMNKLERLTHGRLPVSGAGAERKARGVLSGISQRELQIITLISQGFRNAEVAKKCGIAVKTVKAHITRIFLRLGVPDRQSLIRTSRELGLLPAEGSK